MHIHTGILIELTVHQGARPWWTMALELCWQLQDAEYKVVAMQLQHQRQSEGSDDDGVQAEGSATALLHGSSSSFYMEHVS